MTATEILAALQELRMIDPTRHYKAERSAWLYNDGREQEQYLVSIVPGFDEEASLFKGDSIEHCFAVAKSNLSIAASSNEPA